MTKEEQNTEEIIFEAAGRVFRKKGYNGARMQEIADEANINKSMLHYYYRSKDQLFQKIYQQEMRRFLNIVFGVVNAELPLDEKVEEVVERYYSFFAENPYLPQFIVTEMNQNPERYQKFIKELNLPILPSVLTKQIDDEVEHGKMSTVPLDQLMVSTVALTLFPFICSPMVKAIFDFDDKQFGNFMEERKDFVVNFILNGINYKK